MVGVSGATAGGGAGSEGVDGSGSEAVCGSTRFCSSLFDASRSGNKSGVGRMGESEASKGLCTALPGTEDTNASRSFTVSKSFTSDEGTSRGDVCLEHSGSADTGVGSAVAAGIASSTGGGVRDRGRGEGERSSGENGRATGDGERVMSDAVTGGGDTITGDGERAAKGVGADGRSTSTGDGERAASGVGADGRST